MFFYFQGLLILFDPQKDRQPAENKAPPILSLSSLRDWLPWTGFGAGSWSWWRPTMPGFSPAGFILPNSGGCRFCRGTPKA